MKNKIHAKLSILYTYVNVENVDTRYIMYSILYTYVNVESVGPRILGERESCVTTHQVYKCKIYVFMGSSTFNKRGLKLSFLGNEREKGMLVGKVVISCSASICYFLSFFFV